VTRRDDEGFLGDGVIARIADRALENPAMSGGLLVMALTAAAIVSNAMFLQNIRHPDPIFSTRSELRPLAAKAPSVVPIPRSRAEHLPTPPVPRDAPKPEAAPDPTADATLVAGLQKALAAKGLYRGTVDGKFGDQTRSAIAAFEKAQGLKVTGQPSAALLSQAAAPALRPPKPIPVAAAKPAPVAEKAAAPAIDQAAAREQLRYKRVQAALNSIGYGPVRVDGHAGEETADAIRRFQLDNGLQLDGSPNDRVIARLIKIGAMPAM
jgi:peptidoglycan hydrolase-like protein with peptidoglycan-binding domain